MTPHVTDYAHGGNMWLTILSYLMIRTQTRIPHQINPYKIQKNKIKYVRPWHLWDIQQLCWLSYLTIYQKQCVKSNSTGINEPWWYTKYPCSSPSGVYSAALRYFLGTLRSPLRFRGIPVLKTVSALDTVGRFNLMSRYNGLWLDSTWVVLGLSSWRRARYRCFCSESLPTRFDRCSCSLLQTTFCCSCLFCIEDRYSG